MGKRRYGFLTDWQMSYIKGQIEIPKTRQRVENHYIIQSFKVAVDQFFSVLPWLGERGLTDSSVEILRHLFQPIRGKRKIKTYMFRETIACPFCNKQFSFVAARNDKANEIVILKTFGVETKQTKKPSL